MSQQTSADKQFLRNLLRFLAALVAVFVLLGFGVYVALRGSDGLGYLALFFVVAFGIPAGVLAVFVARTGAKGRGGG
jgi:hypothetical protein